MVVRNAKIGLGSLGGAIALILGWRYWTIGALAYPQPGTDYFAMAVLAGWILVVLPWLSFRERRALRREGLVCPHCDRLWRYPDRKKLAATGRCVSCGDDFAGG
jgi:hypothetical protein